MKKVLELFDELPDEELERRATSDNYAFAMEKLHYGSYIYIPYIVIVITLS